MRRVSTALVVAALVSTGAVSSTALAQEAAPAAEGGEGRGGFHQAGGLLDRSDQTREHQLSFFVGLPWYTLGPGIGARYYFPILANGFIPSLNDEFGLEAGVDAAFGFLYSFGMVLDIPVEVLWRFHFTPKFSAYAKVGVSLEFDFTGYRCNYTYAGACSLVWVNPVLAVGLSYKLSDSISLRAELGYPWAKVGIGINL